ncbi:nucleotidyltransferase family protein [uncultured Selenomonas sp.]|uniref:nucleotidyltransferase family protein n=1 Tax=uncultured Selenomonas sp. TaxID=159275 RepID=UPI0025E52D75|nr:nucleotidyltransferase family protein [uncultured Selenomonas sp.]
MRTIENIREQIAPICKKYGVKSVRLFGSYARGEAHEKSDVDFFVELGHVRDLFTLSAFRLDLIDALQMEVDLVTKLPENPEFQKELTRDEVLLYAA